MMRTWTFFCGLIASGCGTTTTDRLKLPPLEVVQHVDLERYAGTWYDVASFPQRFQKGCTATTAIYTLRDDGRVDVLNRCRKGSLTGKENSISGVARVADPVTNAKLEVSFFWPFWGEYWIIDLDPAYQHAVVGHPSRDYLWILSRRPTLAQDVYADILRRLREQGYPIERLERTIQPEAPPQADRAAP